MRVAVLGLGRMGRELAHHIVADGHEVRVFNRNASAAHDLVLAGATAASTATEAVADADVVVTVLFGPDAVRDVVVTPNLAVRPGTLWIDITTIGPDDATSFATWAKFHALRYVHAPVLGSLAPARAGTLGVLLGGDPEDVAAACAITDLWADPTRVHRFDSAAQAAAAKLLVNLGLAVATQALGEALRVGRASGLTDDTVMAVLDKTPLAGVVAAKGQTLRDRSFEDAQFTVDALLKDARLAVSAGAGPLPALEAAAAALRREQARGRGGWDFSVIASAQGS